MEENEKQLVKGIFGLSRTEKLWSCWEDEKETMPISEAANPCPQTWIAEKTFTDFFSSFNKQSFSVLGGTTTSPNWLEEKVWGKGKGIWLLSTQWNERPTQLIPPMKKRKKNWAYFVFGWSSMKMKCAEVACVYIRLIDRWTALFGLFLSLPLCSVGHRVNGENSSDGWEW